jgi:beta-glucosidase
LTQENSMDAITNQRPTHIDSTVWKITTRLTVEQLVGQLSMIFSGNAETKTGCTMEELVSRGLVGVIALPGGTLPNSYMQLCEIAQQHGQIPPILADDFQRGMEIVGPSGIGAACSFDLHAIHLAAERVARMMRAAGVAINWAPTSDKALGNRNGRGQEGASVESPVLMRRIITAMVTGYQGIDFGHDSVVATLKHVGPYQQTEGADYTVIPISERAFLEDCAPAFIAGLAAGARAIMYSFVAFDGIPSHASKYLRDFVDKHGVPGVVKVSDFTGINEIVCFGVVGTTTEAVYRAFVDAGIHIDLEGDLYRRELPALVASGRISLYELQVRAAEVIQLKKDVGVSLDRSAPVARSRRNKRLEKSALLELAEKAIVLLRPTIPNSAVLPIPKHAQIMVTGPLANDAMSMLGEWSGTARWDGMKEVVTYFRGIQQQWGVENVRCVPGVTISTRDETLERNALACLPGETHIVICLGEPWDWSGESRARLVTKVPDAQVDFFMKLRTATTAKIIVLITAGRPLKIPDRIQQYADAILWVPQLGTYAGEALANVLLGAVNPSGRLAYSLPCHEELHSGYSFRDMRGGRPALPLNEYTRTLTPQATEPPYKSYFTDLHPRNLAEFHFGEGYAYTRFVYTKLRLSSNRLSIKSGKKLTASVVVTNEGTVPGVETVQLFVHDSVAPCVSRRLEHLSWQRVALEPGESKQVKFDITPTMLALLGPDISEGFKARPDEYPVLLFLAPHAGKARPELELRDPHLSFTLVE